MANKDYKKLIMVTGDNNNKFYEMVWEGGSTFTVNYGRVEATSTTITYPYSQWHKKYSEKVKKGYKDVTDFVSVVATKITNKSSGYAKIADAKVHEFMELMRLYRDNLVSTTYSVKAEQVSQKQIDEAQALIDGLNKEIKKKKPDREKIEEWLISLYTVIPRKMKNVRSHLPPNIKVEEVLDNEQDNLDAMASQVGQTNSTQSKVMGKSFTILDELGITMVPCKSEDEIQYLTKQVGKSRYGNVSIEHIFRVVNPKEDKTFNTWLSAQKNKDTRILIHGTKCSSVIPILDIGLKIRPKGNFQFTGKAYGDGNYFSETMDKSLGYTGWDKDKVILVYEVHTGKPFTYDGWYRGNSFTLTYKNLKDRGFDSTFVKAGNGLLNSEIIAYKEEQCRIKYILWLK